MKVLTVKSHSNLQFKGNFMVGSDNGNYCGHSAMVFVPKAKHRSYDCPHIFTNEAEAKDFILQVRLAVAMKHIKDDKSYVQFNPLSERFIYDEIPHAYGFAIDNPRGNLQ